MNNKLIIAIDFDGTIVEHRFPNIGRLLPRVKEIMRRIKENGHKIIIWTCRSDMDLTQAIAFLVANNIPFDEVNKNLSKDFSPVPKIYYDYLIDDRCLFSARPVDWTEVEDKLIRLGAI